MSNLRFLLLSCLVFFIAGPFVAMLASGGLHMGSLLLMPLAYFFGGLTAVKYGAVFTVITLLVTPVLARFRFSKSSTALALGGAMLGFSVCAVVFAAPSIWLTLQAPAAAQPKTNTVGHWLQSDAFKIFGYPLMACGAVVWAWLVPRLLARRHLAEGASNAA
jgi:hypothetical protein